MGLIIFNGLKNCWKKIINDSKNWEYKFPKFKNKNIPKEIKNSQI
jgi:hypothetical protein